MSGILGILNLDGAPAAAGDLASMASLLERRGPDRTTVWSDSSAGLGHTLLATTPELALEGQPVPHRATGCVITADVRLDNREELLASLGIRDRAASIGDAGLILEAYLEWGDSCPEKLMGDFAFAIWDPRRRVMFCARDQFGMRPFYYHHAPGQRLVFASEPRAILVLPQVPYRINEGRVADYLVPALEWTDYTSTFFEHVFRLPPAHILIAAPEGIKVQRYWTLEPGSELRLPSDEAYSEALLAVLTEAVKSRLRGAGPVGSMLSGGLDSGSVVAIASRLLAAENKSPLPTFSGVGPNPDTCIETRTIHAALTMPGLEPHLIDYSDLDQLMPELEEVSWNVDEPFDWMVLSHAVYLTAGRQNVRVVLDGAGSDVVLGFGSYVKRLYRQGRWVDAWRESRGRDRFFGLTPTLTGSLRTAISALTPDVLRQFDPRDHAGIRLAELLRESIISPEFAQRISVIDRLRTLDKTFETGRQPDFQLEQAASVHPNMTAGRERYNRVASAAGVEPRDPFMDRRVVAFCLTLPGAQRLQGGWQKVILRRAMAGLLPDAVRWRRGKEHLGWKFNLSVIRPGAKSLWQDSETVLEALRPFVDPSEVKALFRAYFDDGDQAHETKVLSALALVGWLKRSARRPVARRPESC